MDDQNKMINEVIFWGATGQAKVLYDCLDLTDTKLVAVVDNDPTVVPPFIDIPLLVGRDGFEAWLQSRRERSPLHFLVAIGGSKGKAREEIKAYLKSFGLRPIIARHSTAFIAPDVQIGEGSQILANSSVCVGATLGSSSIVNTSASVDHECHIHDGAHIGPGAHLAGCIEVGRYAFIGVGATVLPRIHIGEGAIIGGGSVVTKDVSPYTVVAGNPARFLREVMNDD